MTEPTPQIPADDQITGDVSTVPGFPKTLRPYRRKLQESATKVAYALSGKSGLSQEAQVKILQAVNAELRKMSAGAAKALEVAQTRDYPAYLEAKEAVKKGKLSKAEQAKFDALTAGLGEGEYDFDGLLDEIGEEAAQLEAVQLPGEDGDTEDDAPPAI